LTAKRRGKDILLPLRGQKGVHRLRRLPVHCGRGVAVEVEGNGDLTVSQYVGHELGVHPLAEKQGSGRVAQVVKTDAGQVGLLQQAAEGASDKDGRLYGPAHLVGKDKTFSSQAGPRRSRSPSWRALWRRSALTAASLSITGRRDGYGPSLAHPGTNHLWRVAGLPLPVGWRHPCPHCASRGPAAPLASYL